MTKLSDTIIEYTDKWIDLSPKHVLRQVQYMENEIEELADTRAYVGLRGIGLDAVVCFVCGDKDGAGDPIKQFITNSPRDNKSKTMRAFDRRRQNIFR